MSATETSVATGTWAIDAVHSSVGFEVKHLGVSTFRGSFKDVAGTITTDRGTVTAVEGTIQTASVQTVDSALNGHLQAPDFFDSANYPQGSFARPGSRISATAGCASPASSSCAASPSPSRSTPRSPAPAATRTATIASACPARPSSIAPSSASRGTPRCRTAC